MLNLSTKEPAYKERHVSAGFTLVELLIVVLVSSILAGMLFGPLNDMYTSNNHSLKNVVQVTDTRSAMRLLERNITMANSFDDVVTDHTGENWRWTGSGPTSRVLITQNYATTIDESQDTAGARTLLFAAPDCTMPLMNTYIYYVRNETLYRRLMKSTDTPCSGSIAQKQSCLSGCPAVDAKLLTKVTSFTVNYYDTASNPTPLADQYTNNAVPSNAKAVVVTVTAKSGDGSVDTTSTQSLRITRKNGA